MSKTEEFKKPPQPVLEDGGFYWVKFSQKDKMEVAKYRANINRFCFTDGSHCSPERIAFIDPRQLDYGLMPEGYYS